MSAHRSERHFVGGFDAAYGLAPSPEERGGDGWGEAEQFRIYARLAPFSATSL